MAKSTHHTKQILVYADWIDLGGTCLMGTLQAEPVRGKEVFSFSYARQWLEKRLALLLDPDLGLYPGPQYSRDDKPIITSFPDVFRRVPLHMVASYLGVSRETLSRIRHDQNAKNKKAALITENDL